MKIGKTKNAELIFQHGLLLSEKFFITDTSITKKYRKKVKAKGGSPRIKNFIDINKKKASQPVIRHPGSRNISPSRFLKGTQAINSPNLNTEPSSLNIRPQTAMSRMSKRVNSVIDSQFIAISSLDKGKFPNLTFTDIFKSSDGDDLDSKATKATKAYNTDASKLSAKVASFSEEDLNKIFESIKKNKTPSNAKINNWADFAEKQMRGTQVYKKKCYACDN